MTSRSKDPQSPGVRVQDLGRRYRSGDGWVDAVRGVSLEVPRGAFVSVVGPSGSGKSTLLSLIGGLDRPTTGAVHVDGQDLSRLTSGELARFRQRSVGFIFQSFRLLPHLTAVENVALPRVLAGAGTTDSTQRAETLLSRMGLAARIAHRPSRLSAGEQQRVAIARALANEPQVLLADEPTGNLDSDSAAAFLELLEEIRVERSLTVIVATHDPDVARRADHLVHLRSGRIAAQA
ncbi:MAG TPA: ABC transporter ATP-binding protein [Candidatus Limnocylindria bacterium]|nr:ABC transporter ATP-binding protein [Candidatus Limnocylindria bacterium]